jgi:hypothetical protein
MHVSFTASYAAVSTRDALGNEIAKNLASVFQNKAMKCRLHLKVVNSDKALMIQNTNVNSQERTNGSTTSPDAPTEGVVVPPPRDLQPDAEWITIVSGEGTPMSAGDLEKAKWKEGDGIWYI